MNTLVIADVRSHYNKGICTGHYLPVAANYQEIFNGVRNVKIAGGPIYKSRFKDDEMMWLPWDVEGFTLKSKLHIFANCRSLFRKAVGCTIVLQHASLITACIGIALFYKRKSRLFLINYATENFDKPIKRFIFNLAKRKIDGIICPTDGIGRASGLPYVVVPDYIFIGETERQSQISYSDKKYDFCMVGRIACEKNVAEVARVLAGTKYHVLIAGNPESKYLGEELKEISSKCTNIELHLGYISDEEYFHNLLFSRYAILNYTGAYSERSSGVVFDTIFNEVPVIGHRCKSLKFIAENNVGCLYDKLQDLDFDDMLNEKSHRLYVENICRYRKEFAAYRQKLIDFLQ